MKHYTVAVFRWYAQFPASENVLMMIQDLGVSPVCRQQKKIKEVCNHLQKYN